MKKRTGIISVACALALMLSACGNGTSQNQEVSENSVETDDKNIADNAGEDTDMNIVITVGDQKVTAVMEDSETTRQFMDMLPMTVQMSRYADREYYAALETQLSENGEAIEDFSEGDITYFTSGGSLAIFFNKDSSSQSDLIRMGRITSGLDVLMDAGDTEEFLIERAASDTEESQTSESVADSSDEEQIMALYERMQQAMVDKDVDTLREIMGADTTVRHITGRTQTMDEWLSDIENEEMKYYSIDITEPQITVDGDNATMTCSNVIDARIYGSRGTWTLSGGGEFEKADGEWRMVH